MKYIVISVKILVWICVCCVTFYEHVFNVNVICVDFMIELMLLSSYTCACAYERNKLHMINICFM